MISKFWPKKTGNFANCKHSDRVDESKISPSGKEDESKYPAKEEAKGRRTSSKFYVEIDGDSVGGASDLSLNSVSPTASESCLNGDIMSSTDSAYTDVSCSVPLKPGLKPKPKIPSPLPSLNHLPVPGAVPERINPCAVKPPASPVRVQACPRTSCFPPPWPPSPRQELIRCQESEQNDRAKQSSEVSFLGLEQDSVTRLNCDFYSATRNALCFDWSDWLEFIQGRFSQRQNVYND